jgi:serine/threonine protein kinase
MPADLTKLHHT